MSAVLGLLAQATQDTGPGSMMMIGYVVIFIAIFYFAIIAPQKRREKEQKTMMDAIRSGDKIVFSGGIVGVVTNVKEDRLIVRVADSTKLEILRAAVVKVLEREEDEKK